MCAIAFAVRRSYGVERAARVSKEAIWLLLANIFQSGVTSLLFQSPAGSNFSTPSVLRMRGGMSVHLLGKRRNPPPLGTYRGYVTKV
jgi:hypothetical protein